VWIAWTLSLPGAATAEGDGQPPDGARRREILERLAQRREQAAKENFVEAVRSGVVTPDEIVTLAEEWNAAVRQAATSPRGAAPASASAAPSATPIAAASTPKAPAPPEEAPASPAPSEASSAPEPSFGPFLLHAGLVTLNPFKIEKNDAGNFQLETDEQSAHGFIELIGSHRPIWDPNMIVCRGGQSIYRSDCISGGFRGILRNIDLETRLGYFFGADEKSGSTIVGSGDLSGEINLGVNALRVEMENGIRLGLNLPEVSFAAVSGRNVQDIHLSWTYGLGFLMGIPNPIGPKQQRIQMRALFGGSSFEIPDMIGSSSEVAAENGFPEFVREWGGWSTQIEARYPISKSTFLTAMGRFFHGADPNPWSLQIGVQLNPQKLNDVISGAVGILGGPPPAQEAAAETPTL